jgi:putative ABC transport system permease protein
MPFYWLFQIALRTLSRNRKMHGITSLAIIIGMSIFLLGDALINGIDEQIIRDQEQVVSGEISFQPFQYSKKMSLQNLQPLDLELASFLETAEIKSWTTRTLLFTRLYTKNEQILTRVNGYNIETDAKVFPRDTWDIQGNEPSGTRDIGVGSILAKKLSIQIGDALVLESRTKDGAMNAIEYRCSGIIQTHVMEMDSLMLWLPMQSIEELLQTKKHYSQISLQIQGSREQAKVFLQKQSFKHWVGSTAEDAVQNQLALSRFRRKAINFISTLLLCIAGLGLNNTMMMLCFNRKKECGVLLALGLSPRKIIVLFLLEGAMLGLFSGIIASIIGGGLSYYFSQYGIDLSQISSQIKDAAFPPIIYAQFSVHSLIFVCSISVLLAFVASLLPILLLLRTPTTLLLAED